MAHPSAELQRLQEMIHHRLGVTVRPGDSIGALGVDSLALMELVAVLEKEFGFRADQDLFDVETVAELAQYIRERRR